MTKKKDKKIIKQDGISSIRTEYISIRKDNLPDIPMTQVFFLRGKDNASIYTHEELMEMLKSTDIHEIYEAIGAIGKLKLKKALESLKYKALYDDDLAIQEEAIRTIRRIGGRKALDILEFLKTTDHKKLIDVILKYGADYEISAYDYKED